MTILALAAGFKNFKVDTAALTDILVQVAGLVGAALAMYGRIKADRPIRFLGGTVPGGAFNPAAPVKKAEPAIQNPKSNINNSTSGRADLDALLLAGMAFLILGMALYAVPDRKVPLVSRDVPEVVCGRPAAEWVKVVRVEDKRPFFQRLLASVRPGKCLALARGTGGGQVTEIQLVGGAEF